MTSADTSQASAELHEEVLSRLGIGGRLQIALELSDLTHDLATAGMRRRKGLSTDEEARREMAEMLYGTSSARAR